MARAFHSTPAVPLVLFAEVQWRNNLTPIMINILDSLLHFFLISFYILAPSSDFSLINIIYAVTLVIRTLFVPCHFYRPSPTFSWLGRLWDELRTVVAVVVVVAVVTKCADRLTYVI